MTRKALQPLSELLLPGIQKAVAQAIERHRRLGQSIAVMRDGQVVILISEEIEPFIQPLIVADRNPETEASIGD